MNLYPVALHAGCVAGIYLGSRVAAASGLDPRMFAIAAVGLTPFALLGARWLHRIRTGSRSEGGAAVYGGLLAAMAASAAIPRLTGLPFWAFWDAASVTMICGLLVTKFGCLAAGCCAGRETTSRWFGVTSRNARGEYRRRYPAQLLEAAWAACILIQVRERTAADGSLFVAIGGAYGAGRILLETIRERERPNLSNFNFFVSALLVLAAAARWVQSRI